MVGYPEALDPVYVMLADLWNGSIDLIVVEDWSPESQMLRNERSVAMADEVADRATGRGWAFFRRNPQ